MQLFKSTFKSCADEDFPAGKPLVGVPDPDYHGTDARKMWRVYPCEWGQDVSVNLITYGYAVEYGQLSFDQQTIESAKT